MSRNEAILAEVEVIGGGYVWEAEVFAVNLMDVAAADGQVEDLQHLRGVQQIALNASKLSFRTVSAIAGIPGLESLVLAQATLSSAQLHELQRIVPEVVLVGDQKA